MNDSLLQIFNELELSWIDTTKELLTSQIYAEILHEFPNLKEIYREGLENDREEFIRTFRHTLRVFKVYYLLKNGTFVHDSLSARSLKKLNEKVNTIDKINDKVLPLILMYHDIGRFFDKKDHPYQSHLVITDKKLLENVDLTDAELLLIDKIIQYHLLFASIYTGEATYFGISSLFNDLQFMQLISNEKHLDLFVDLLEIFTYIDILGYSYAQIFDHYIKYFNEINLNLKQILKLWPNKTKALIKATNISQDWIEWRIAGAMRIFQFIETKPYLTREFYFNKLKESVKQTNYDLIDGLEWESIKKKYLTHVSQVQIKYGLGFLMILAFGNLFRSRIKKEREISDKLIMFWIFLSKEVNARSNDDNIFPWNVYFINLPNLYKQDKEFAQKLDFTTLERIIKNSKTEFDEIKKENVMFLDFKGVI